VNEQLYETFKERCEVWRRAAGPLEYTAIVRDDDGNQFLAYLNESAAINWGLDGAIVEIARLPEAGQ
jgi:hypothetical protein